MSDGYSDDFEELSTPDDTPRPVASSKPSATSPGPLDADHFSSYHTSPATTTATSPSRSPHGRSQSPTYPIRPTMENLISRTPTKSRSPSLGSRGVGGGAGLAYPTEDGMLGGGEAGSRPSLTAKRLSLSKQDVTAARLAAGGANVKHAMHVSRVTTVQKLDEDDEEADYAHELSSEKANQKGTQKKKSEADPWHEIGDSDDDAASPIGTASSDSDASATSEEAPASSRAPVAAPTRRLSGADQPRAVPLSMQGAVAGTGAATGGASDSSDEDEKAGESKAAGEEGQKASYVAHSERSSVAASSPRRKESSASESQATSSHASSATPSSSAASSSSATPLSSPAKPSSSEAADVVGIRANAYPREDNRVSPGSEPQRNSNSTSATTRRPRRQVNAAAGATSAYDQFNGQYPSRDEDNHSDEEHFHSPKPRATTASTPTAAAQQDDHERDALIARCVELRSEIEEWNERIAQQEHERKLLRQRQQQQQQQQQQARRGKSGGKGGENQEARLARLRKENEEMASEVASYDGNEVLSVAFLVARAQKQLLAAKARLAEAKKVKRALASRDKRAAHTIEEVHRRQPDAGELEQRQVNEGLYSLASLERQRRELKIRIKKSEASRDVMQHQCDKLEKEVSSQSCARITPKEFEALQERFFQAQKSVERAKTAIAVYTNAINHGLNGNSSAATPRRRASRAESQAGGAGNEDLSADLLDAYARQRQALEAEKAELLLKIEQREAIIDANNGGAFYTKPRALPTEAKKGAEGKKKTHAHTPPSRHPSRRTSAVGVGEKPRSRAPSSAQAKLGAGAGPRRASHPLVSPKQGAARRRSSNGRQVGGRGAAASPPKKMKNAAPAPAAAAAASPSNGARSQEKLSDASPTSHSKLPELAVESLVEVRSGGGIADMSPSVASKHEDSLDDVLRAIDADNARLLHGLDAKEGVQKVSSPAINVKQHPFLSEAPMGYAAVEDEVDDMFGPSHAAAPELARKADNALDAALVGNDDVVDEVPEAVAAAVSDDNGGDSGRETPPWLR